MPRLSCTWRFQTAVDCQNIMLAELDIFIWLIDYPTYHNLPRILSCWSFTGLHEELWNYVEAFGQLLHSFLNHYEESFEYFETYYACVWLFAAVSYPGRCLLWLQNHCFAGERPSVQARLGKALLVHFLTSWEVPAADGSKLAFQTSTIWILSELTSHRLRQRGYRFENVLVCLPTQ